MIVDASVVVDAVCDAGRRGVAARSAWEGSRRASRRSLRATLPSRSIPHCEPPPTGPITLSGPPTSPRLFTTPSPTRSTSRGPLGLTCIELGPSRIGRSVTPAPFTSPLRSDIRLRCSPPTAGSSAPGQDYVAKSSPSPRLRRPWATRRQAAAGDAIGGLHRSWRAASTKRHPTVTASEPSGRKSQKTRRDRGHAQNAASGYGPTHRKISPTRSTNLTVLRLNKPATSMKQNESSFLIPRAPAG